jgi:hypothetical protein
VAREIVVLDVRVDAVLTITAVFWLGVPAALVRANASATSAVPPLSSVTWGITAAELAALQAGTVREVVQTITGNKNATQAQAQAVLQQAYADAQSALNGTAPPNHWIGASWDGTSWTAAP